MDEFVKECPVLIGAVRNNGVNERDCGHFCKLRQRASLETHFREFSIKGRIAYSFWGKRYDSRGDQCSRRKEGTHNRQLGCIQERCPISVGTPLLVDVGQDLLNEPLYLLVAEFRKRLSKFLGCVSGNHTCTLCSLALTLHGSLRRRNPIRANSPVPNVAKVAGSGVTAVSETESVVFGGIVAPPLTKLNSIGLPLNWAGAMRLASVSMSRQKGGPGGQGGSG